jgi:hypothetical protein
MRKVLSQYCGFLLLFCLLFYTFLSWVLFFRDFRAILGISHFYPGLLSPLTGTMVFLTHHGLNTIPTLLFLIFAVCAFFIYFLSIKQNITIRTTVIFSILFGFFLFFSYPILSTDIFSYIFSDRIATVYHQNIWTVLPIIHNSDPFAIMSDWKNTTSIYGGVNLLVYSVPAIWGGNNFVTLVILYKLVSFIFAFGTLAVLYLLLRSNKNTSTNIAKNIRLVFWNPLFLLEIFGSGHNDSVMIFFTLLAYYFFIKKNHAIAGVVLACAVQIKLIPVLLFIFIALYLFQKKLYKQCSLFAVSFIISNIICFWLMGVSPITFAQRVSYNAGVYWQSLPNIVRYFIPGSSPVFIFLFIGVLIGFIIYQIRAKQPPLKIYAYTLTIYLFFFAAAYWNWYALWILTLLPFLENAKFKFIIIIFSFMSILAYPLYWLSLRYDYHSMIWPVITYLLISIVPVTLYFLMQKIPFIKQFSKAYLTR